MGKMNIEKTIRQIARKEGKPVEEIYKDMQRAILVGMLNPDPLIKEKWSQIPCVDEIPTPEELIKHLTGKVKKSTLK